MVSHCTVGLLVLGSQRDEERGGERRREGTQRWTGKAAFNLAPATSSQLSEGDCVCASVYLCVYVGVCCICMSVSVLVCVCVVYAPYIYICRSISGEVNQQAA